MTANHEEDVADLRELIEGLDAPFRIDWHEDAVIVTVAVVKPKCLDLDYQPDPFSKRKLGAFRGNLAIFAGNLTHSFEKWHFLPETWLVLGVETCGKLAGET